MIYVDPFYLEVVRHLADGKWHSAESIEKALLLKGFRLHETCRVGAILEAEVDDPEAKTDAEAEKKRRADFKVDELNGKLVGLYRLNATGLARLKELAPAKPPEKLKQQKGLF